MILFIFCFQICWSYFCLKCTLFMYSCYSLRWHSLPLMSGNLNLSPFNQEKFLHIHSSYSNKALFPPQAEILESHWSSLWIYAVFWICLAVEISFSLAFDWCVGLCRFQFILQALGHACLHLWVWYNLPLGLIFLCVSLQFHGHGDVTLKKKRKKKSSTECKLNSLPTC